MKRILIFLIIAVLCFGISGCKETQPEAQIVATTLPVYTFALELCRGTDLKITQLITEAVSCLHDYTLQTSQMRAIENAEVIILSGSGLEDFIPQDLLSAKKAIDTSAGISLTCNDHEDSHDHHHDQDPHIWLSPANARIMAQNICKALSEQYPEQADVFAANLEPLIAELNDLEQYASEKLAGISTREIITFHDGFSYMAEAFGLSIIHAIEEESGSEASALELIELIDIVNTHDLNAIFTERNGSTAAAQIIAAETGAKIYTLDMAISGKNYFDAMYNNINTLKEALS